MSLNPTNSHRNSQKSEKIARNFQKKKIHNKQLGYVSEDWLQNQIMSDIFEVQNGKM